jgi:hypothetical protein
VSGGYVKKQARVLIVILCAVALCSLLALMEHKEDVRASSPVVRVATPARALNSAPPEAPTAANGEPREHPPADEDAEAALRKRIANIGKRATAPLAERWAHEPRDPRWGPFQSKIASFLDDFRHDGLELVSVDCRTTLCRYELLVEDREAIQRMLDVARNEHTFEGSMGIPVFDEDRFTMYLSPPGVPLLKRQLPPQLMELAKKSFGVDG